MTGAYARARRRVAAGNRRLRFQLDVANVVMPRHLPNVCGQATAQATFAPQRVPLRMKLRILRRGERPLIIRARPSYVCRDDRSGTLRGRRVQRARKAPKPARVSVKLRAPRRLAAGETGTLTATVRNRRRKAAHDVLVQASLPRGLRIVRADAGARVRSPQIGWRLERLRRGKLRTFEVTVRPMATGGTRRCSDVSVRARGHRSAAARACMRVR